MTLLKKYELFKIHFTNFLQGEKNKKILNTLYTEIMQDLEHKYKNTYSLLRSSLIFYCFLNSEDFLIKQIPSELKKLFYLENIISNIKINNIEKIGLEKYVEETNSSYNELVDEEFCFVYITTNCNLLEYHPLVLKYPEHKNKIIKTILNKLVLALKIDICDSSSFIDFYSDIENSLDIKKHQGSKNEKSNVLKSKTGRGGIKKKIKLLKKLNRNVT